MVSVSRSSPQILRNSTWQGESLVTNHRHVTWRDDVRKLFFLAFTRLIFFFTLLEPTDHIKTVRDRNDVDLPHKQLNDRVYTMLDSHYTNHFYLKCHYLMFSSCIMNWDRCSQCCSLTQIQIVPSAFMAPRGSYSTVASAPRNIGKVKDMQSEVFHLGQGLLDVNSPWSSESLHQCSSGN